MKWRHTEKDRPFPAGESWQPGVFILPSGGLNLNSKTEQQRLVYWMFIIIPKFALSTIKRTDSLRLPVLLQFFIPEPQISSPSFLQYEQFNYLHNIQQVLRDVCASEAWTSSVSASLFSRLQCVSKSGSGERLRTFVKKRCKTRTSALCLQHPKCTRGGEVQIDIRVFKQGYHEPYRFILRSCWVQMLTSV